MDKLISELIKYSVDCGLLPAEDAIYAANRLLDVFHMDGYEKCKCETIRPIEFILADMLDEAEKRGLIEGGIAERDLFDTRIMGCVTPPPSQMIAEFKARYKSSPEEATDYFYNISCNSDYIRTYRIKKDIRWSVPSEYGDIDISINLSKPEKDPKAIAAAKTAVQSGYPKCQLCMENEGYAGRLTHPARQNHRIMPITIAGQKWGFQYSPYVYYNEHCIALNGEHIPMKIERETFRKLFDFIRVFPHYFIGSNADLPIVGGSILSHDHFQGGRYTFAMEKAPVEKSFIINGFEDIEAGIVKWPLSVIRIRGEKPERLIELADHILSSWRGYTDEEAFVFAETDGEKHNTITPIARMRDGRYELDLTLRNNITTEEYPLGVYHPHPEYHHLKKENIGLIEVMGLAILPARLKNEIAKVRECILNGKDAAEYDEIAKHAKWVSELKEKYEFNEENTESILQTEIGNAFVKILENAGVYKCTETGRSYFMRFISSL